MLKKATEPTTEPLFRGQEVDVLGITGEYNTGKTMFVLSIAPGATMYYDFEKSGANHAKNLGVSRRVDVPAALQGKFSNKSKHPNGYSPMDAFEWWLQDVRSITPGECRIIAVDTIGDIETGLADYVANKLHSQHGYKTAESFQAMGGVFWGAVKAFWKVVLADVASRCECFVFTAHLKTKYKGKIATSDQTPMGKSTLMELASLYLWLERSQTEVPSGRVLKSRLSKASLVEGRLKAVDILPPKLPEASYWAICQYIDNPAGDRDLDDSERVTQKPLSDDERLQLRAEIAENERVVAEQKREETERRTERASKLKAAKSPSKSKEPTAEAEPAKPDDSPKPEPAPPLPKAEPPAAAAEPKEAKQDAADTAEAAPVETTTQLITGDMDAAVTIEQLRRIAMLKKELEISDAGYRSALQAYNVTTARQFTKGKADMFIQELVKGLEKTEADKYFAAKLSSPKQ